MTLHLTEVSETAHTIEEEVAAVEQLIAPAQEVAVTNEGAVAVHSASDAPLVSKIMDLASNPNVNPEMFDRLVAWQEREVRRQEEMAFNAAFVRFQAKRPVIRRNGTIAYPTKPGEPARQISKYAKWEDIEDALQPILREEGFSLAFSPEPREGGGLLVSTILRHEGGHIFISKPFPVPLDTSGGKNNIQGYGSALSYGKRYSADAAGLFRVEGQDDDGKAGGTIYVTPEQALELQSTALAAEREESRFLETYTSEARSFEEVQEKDFVRLMRLLTSAKRQVEQRKAKEGAAT
jgi:ERF superfamily protein